MIIWNVIWNIKWNEIKSFYLICYSFKYIFQKYSILYYMLSNRYACFFFYFERWKAKVHMQLKWCALNLLPKILDVRSHRQEQLFYSDLSRIASEAQRQPLRRAPTNLPFVGLKHHHFLNGTVRISTKIFCLMYILISKCWESELWTACKR